MAFDRLLLIMRGRRKRHSGIFSGSVKDLATHGTATDADQGICVRFNLSDDDDDDDNNNNNKNNKNNKNKNKNKNNKNNKNKNKNNKNNKNNKSNKNNKNNKNNNYYYYYYPSVTPIGGKGNFCWTF